MVNRIIAAVLSTLMITACITPGAFADEYTAPPDETADGEITEYISAEDIFEDAVSYEETDGGIPAESADEGEDAREDGFPVNEEESETSQTGTDPSGDIIPGDGEGGDAEIEDDENVFAADEETGHGVPEIITSANHEKYIILRWTAVEGASGYRVAHRLDKGSWEIKEVPLTSVDSSGVPRTNFEDLTEGGTYTFIVYADFPDGSFTKSASRAQMRLSTPLISAECFSSCITLKWDKVQGGSCCKVYYREKGSSAWQFYASVPVSASRVNIKYSVAEEQGMLKIEPGKCYEAAVLPAISVPGITAGFPTAPVQVYISETQTLPDEDEYPATEITSISNRENGMLVCWKAVDGAAFYRLSYRKNSGSWETADIPADTADSTGNPYMIFENPDEGEWYTFSVYTFFSERFFTKSPTKSYAYLSAPAVKAKFEVDYVQVEWTEVSGCSCYYIYYREQGSTCWSEYAFVKAGVTSAKVKDSVIAEKELPAITEGKIYEFAVAASTGGNGAFSALTPEPATISTIPDETDSAMTEPSETENNGRDVVVHVYSGESLLLGVRKAYAIQNKMRGCSITVHVHPGTYDIIAEYKSCFGEDYFTSYKGDDDGVMYNDCKNGNFDYGLWLDNITLICDSGVRVVANYTGKNVWVSRYFSAFAVGSHARVEGLNVEADNLRYAIHPDFHTDPKNEELVFINCVFSNGSAHRQYQSFGCGLGVHTKLLIEDCVFRTPDSDSEDSIAILIHNNINKGAQSEVTVTNCAFEGKGYARIAYYGDSKLETTVVFSGCTWTNAPQLEQASEEYDNENIRLIFKAARNKLKTEAYA